MTGEIFDLAPFANVEFLGPKQHEHQREDATLRCTTRKNGAQPGRVLVGTSTVCTQDTRVRWKAVLHATFQTTLVRDVRQVSGRFGTATLEIIHLFQNPLLRRSSDCRFLFVTWPDSS